MTPDTDAPGEHRQTIQTEPAGRDRAQAQYRRACSCGWRGTWLLNPKKVAPCPRPQEER